MSSSDKYMPKLVILDVDGVMCNGKYYGDNGDVVAKNFVDIDWTAIKCFRATGIPVVFLSGDANNAAVARKRNIPFFHSRSDDGTLNKGALVTEIMSKYGSTFENTVYVGDDIFDIEAMDMVHWAFCPDDASPRVMTQAIALDRASGQGVVAVLFATLQAGGWVGYPDIATLKAWDRVES